jgi:helicase
MRILGLFVGVDKQQDDGIRTLTFSGRDAEALHATFGDLAEQLGQPETDNVALIGADATRANVMRALDDLSRFTAAAPADLIVVHFSCHGTPDGVLILTDTMDGRETDTGLPHTALREKLERLRARNIIVLLDCCFSGFAAGHRRLQGDGTAEARSLEALLQSILLENVEIVMASQASEPGYESPRLRHGIFSFAMAATLTGTELKQGAGEISLASWLQAGIARAMAEASRDGLPQTPKRLGGWSGDPHIPAPQHGRRQAQLREREDLHQVTNNLDTLAAYHVGDDVITALRGLIDHHPLNALQLRAINEGGALAGRNVVVAAPTSSGKTLIGYLAALATAARRGRAVMLLPMKALVSEKWQEFEAAFGPCGISAVRSFGGVNDDDPALRTNHYDLAFLTYEKFLTLAFTWPSVLDGIETLVLDEIHLIANPNRGKTVELLLTLVRQRALKGRRIQLVCLSAGLGNTNGFEDWIDGRLIRQSDTTRPTPLLEGVISPTGKFRYRDSRTGAEGTSQLFAAIAPRSSGEYPDTTRMRVASETVAALMTAPTECVLAFPYSKKRTQSLASELGKRLKLAAATSTMATLGEGASGNDASSASNELRARLADGVGFHTADLDLLEKEAIETAFRRGDLRLVVSTSGLAMGINTPATSVVVVDLERYRGKTNEPFSVGEYKNMAGRAGRSASDATPGQAFLCAADDREADRLFMQYVLGAPEALDSQLARLSASDLTLALLLLAGQVSEGDLVASASQTFDGHQHSGDTAWRRQRRNAVRTAIEDLVRQGYARIDNGLIELTDAGRVLGRSSLSAHSSNAVVAAARTIVAAGESLDTTALIALSQLSAELEDIWIGAEAPGAVTWEKLARAKFLANRKVTGDALHAPDAVVSASHFKRMYCAALWAMGTPIHEIETEANHRAPGDRDIGAGTVRQLASRIASIVAPLAKVIALAIPDHAESVRQAGVAIAARLEVGVATEAAPLAKLRLGLQRGELRRLVDIGRVDFSELLAALERGDPGTVAIFGNKRAATLLEKMRTVGEKLRRQQEREAADQLRLFDDFAAVDVV